MVGPRDAHALDVDFASHFGGRSLELNAGVGGDAHFLREDGRVEFVHADGAPQSYRLPLRIAVPTPATITVPSVLGMDFIEHFRMTVSVSELRVELEALFDSAR